MENIYWLQLKGLRRHLHQYPEVSGQEFATSKTIQDFLKQNAKGQCINLTPTGFLWRMDSGKPGKTITIRAELDALPIKEINTFAHASVHPGVSHKCGHDGHAVVLCGTILTLMSEWPDSGCYQFLFQPAEENGEGARAILDSNLHQFETDYIFALHNLPGFPMHQVLYRHGSFTAAVRSIIIKLTGKTSHAAEPENGINPALAIAEIIQKTDALNVNNTDREDFAVVTPVHLKMGEISYGISAGYGEVRLTLRTWTDAHLERIALAAVAIVEQTAAKYGLVPDISWTEFFSANENNAFAVDLIAQAAKATGLEAVLRHSPFKWGEDFGLFTQKFKGAMFGLGAGESTPALHNPDYDFPDELLESGVKMFSYLMREAMIDD